MSYKVALAIFYSAVMMAARRGVTPSFCRIKFTTDTPAKSLQQVVITKLAPWLASGLLDTQRHCLSSQTFDKEPVQVFVEAFAATFRAFAAPYVNTLFSLSKPKIRLADFQVEP